MDTEYIGTHRYLDSQGIRIQVDIVPPKSNRDVSSRNGLV